MHHPKKTDSEKEKQKLLKSNPKDFKGRITNELFAVKFNDSFRKNDLLVGKSKAITTISN